MTGIMVAMVGGGNSSKLSIQASPAIIRSITDTTLGCTATVSGGTAPYTYQWEILSGSNVSANAPTGSSTTFSTSGKVNVTATAKCTVQDNAGAVATSNVVNVTLFWDGSAS